MTSSSAHASYFLSQLLDLFVIRSRYLSPLLPLDFRRFPLRDIENINLRLKFFRDENKQRSSSIRLPTWMFSNEMEMKVDSKTKLICRTSQSRNDGKSLNNEKNVDRFNSIRCFSHCRIINPFWKGKSITEVAELLTASQPVLYSLDKRQFDRFNWNLRDRELYCTGITKTPASIGEQMPFRYARCDQMGEKAGARKQGKKLGQSECTIAGWNKLRPLRDLAASSSFSDAREKKRDWRRRAVSY